MFTKVRIMLILVICMVLATACGSNGHNDEPSHENASTETLDEAKSNAENEEETKQENEKDLNTDETDGQISEKKILGYSMTYDLSGKPRGYIIYEYDDHGIKTEETGYSKIDGNIEAYDYTYYDNTYNDEGILVKQVGQGMDGDSKTEIEYDVNGNMLHISVTDQFGDISLERYNEYDSSGCITKCSAMNKEGIIEDYLVRKTGSGADIYEIDKDGQEVFLYEYEHIGKRSICRRQSGADGSTYGSYVYSDEHGYPVEVVTQEGTHYYKREYDDEGNMLSVCPYYTASQDSAMFTINHYYDLDQYLESSDLYEDEPYEILNNEIYEENIPVDAFDEFKE